jgi:hypothetical protein
MMLAHGFTLDMMVEITRGGLASAEPWSLGRDTAAVARVRITEAGRRALDDSRIGNV